MNKTAISWTDYTSNPIHVTRLDTGKRGWHCVRVGPECEFCYAAKINRDKFGTGLDYTAVNSSRVQWVLNEKELVALRKQRVGARVFLGDMSDLFLPGIPQDFLKRVFETMNETPQHTYQILTKRPRAMAAFPGPWMANIWAGTSVGYEPAMHRIEELRKVPAAVRFLSCEPLIGPLPGIDLRGIHWVIVGGESGLHMPHHPDRNMDHAWARDIRDACVAQNVAFFFKQSSGIRTEMGTDLIEEDGRRTTWHQYPACAATAPAAQALVSPLSLF